MTTDPHDFDLQHERRGDELHLTLSGRVEFEHAATLYDALRAAVADGPGHVHLDLGGVTYFDSSGSAVLAALREDVDARGGSLAVEQVPEAVQGMLRLVERGGARRKPPARQRTPSRLARIGQAGLDALADARHIVAFTGEVALGLRDAAQRPWAIRWRETWQYMERVGVDALPIVALISFLMGLVTAFQAAIQLEQFGADIYIANLTGLAITRELGPLMTAIILAGRSGAAFAAEIGTMKVSEEVDALTVMGLDRTRFLVVPKALAMLAMVPCLTLFADLVGILGGMTVAVGWLELPVSSYLRQSRIAMVPWDIISGLIKSVVFALLIAGTGCLRGFQAKTGAESVGRVTTSAVVSSIFLIILADAVFTVLFHYWG